MERENSYILALLRAFLLEQEPQKPEGVAWGKLYELAATHNVAGILGYMAMRYPICEDPSLQARLRGECLNTVMLFTQRAQKAKQRLKVLVEMGIDCVAMKGLLVREYYPVPELRTFSDVDLLIHPEDRERTHEQLLSWGFQVKTDWEPVYSYRSGSEYYEIHTRIMEVDISPRADYQGYFDRAWAHAVRADDGGYVFTPEFHFIYLLTHIAKHAKGAGAGVRMYLDIAAFIRHYADRADWAYIRRELESIALYEFACTVLTCVESWFGVTCPGRFDRIDEGRLARFTEFTMEAGLFGHQREGGVNTLRKAEGSRMAIVLRRAFPDAKSIEARYTYLQKCPWLLPVAWVHRLVKTRKTWNRHTHEAQVIFTADTEEVSRLKRICEENGI